MEPLTALQKKILSAISETTAFAFEDVEQVYRRVFSFDKTIEVLNKSKSHHLHYKDIIAEMQGSYFR